MSDVRRSVTFSTCVNPGALITFQAAHNDGAFEAEAMGRQYQIWPQRGAIRQQNQVFRTLLFQCND